MEYKSLDIAQQGKVHDIRLFLKKVRKNQSGQSFIEFLFLLLILIGLSFTLIASFNGTVAKQWEAIIKAVALPSDPADDLEL